MAAQGLILLISLQFLAFQLSAESPKRIRLFVGESKVIEADHPKKMVLGNKEVADVSLLSNTEILVNAKAEGQTSLMVWPREGEPQAYELEIQPHGLRKTMVQVDVQVLELANSDNWDLGIDWGHLSSGPEGVAAGLARSPRQFLEQNPGVLAFGTFSRGPIDAIIDLLVEKNKARLLAKPKLLTVSGGSASFLAGGEVPVVNQDSQGRTNTEYKNYGVNLDILPTADESGNVNATLRAEVSTLDAANSVRVGNGILPALKTRWVKTTIFVKKDGTIVIAGLIQEEEGKVTRGVPLLSEIPLLGELFKSTRLMNKRTEMVIFVTPRVLG
jgi:Flp pilus assembly secretin CpaC